MPKAAVRPVGGASRWWRRAALGIAIGLSLSLAGGEQVGAQTGPPSRTWVSGVGADTPTCGARNLACKTFAGAYLNTDAGGEINVLDSAGFGALTITKSISIVADGFIGGVLVSGTNGIIIAAGANDVVVLRGLDVEGLGTGLNGINVTSVGSLVVENSTINDFTQNGIRIATPASVDVHLTNVVVRNTTGASAAGVTLNTASGQATATPTPTLTPTPTATIVYTPCSPRPNINVQVVQFGPGRLQVTVSARTNPGQPTNLLQQIQFGTASNAVIDLPGGLTGSTGNLTVPMAAGTTGYTFALRRTGAGLFQIPFTATDGCGGVPTFAGGGASVS